LTFLYVFLQYNDLFAIFINKTFQFIPISQFKMYHLKVEIVFQANLEYAEKGANDDGKCLAERIYILWRKVGRPSPI